MNIITPVPEKTDIQRGFDYIGVTCAFFCHDGKGNILLHKRSQQCRDEQGNWDNGGGALEFGEDWYEAVAREIKEEYCATAKDVTFAVATNVLREHDGKQTHWVALIFTAKLNPEEVAIGEPHKMDDIGWFAPDSLPNPLHSQFLRHFEYVKAGIVK